MIIDTKSRATAFAVALTLSISACGGSGGDTTTTLDPGSMSLPQTSTTVPETTTIPETGTTSRETTTTIPGAASAEANATLDAIRLAATGADLQRLAELALSSETTFTASFGQTFTDPSDLAAFWATFQDPSVPEVVVGLLDAGYRRTFANNEDGSQVAINVTPAVMDEESTQAD